MPDRNANIRKFPFQFLLADRDVPVESDWILHAAAGWRLYVDPGLPITTISGVDGGFVGWLLGFAFCPGGSSPGSPRTVSEGTTEDWLYGHGGRFALIQIAPSPRIYLDPFGACSVVYSSRARLVASSISRLPDSDGLLDQELVEAYDIPNKDRYYPFGVTQRFDVARLLPNHYLDLDDWSARRHWPHADSFEIGLRDEQIFDAISDLLERQISTIASTFDCYLPLTAGQDSRMLLACARAVLPRTALLTHRLGDPSSDLDCRMAARISKALGLKHSIIPYKEATAQQRNGWLDRTGHCVAGRVLKNVAASAQIDPHLARLSGLGGEVGRGYWWRRDDDPSIRPSGEKILARTKQPKTSRVLQAAEAWLDDVPDHVNNTTLLELAYIEQRMGCWAGPQNLGNVARAPAFMPLCHREIVRLMMSLSVEARRESRLAREVILRKWPELMAWPFNQEVGLRRRYQKVRDALTVRAARLFGRLG